MSPDEYHEILAPYQPSSEVLDTEPPVETDKCDKTGYMIAAFCGAMAGLMDVLFVQAPNEGSLQSAVDKKADDFTIKAAQFFWKHDKRESGKNKKMPVTLEKCISYLEQAFPVPYDARYAADLMAEDGILANMKPQNHHLLSLAHAPDPIGLVFSIIDQFNNTATFIDQGKVIHAVPSKTSGAIPYMVGANLPAKLYCGFINWIGHILSDLVGSSSTRKPEKNKRGMGVPIPFYELFLKCDFGPDDGKTFAETMIKVYENGYDLRFGATMAIPVILEELMVRTIWALRQRMERKKPWKECIPNASHADLRVMLLVSNGVFFAIDGVDAIIHGVSSHSTVNAICHLNLVGFSRLAVLGVKEIAIRLRIKLFEEERIQEFFGESGKSDYQWILAAIKQLQGSMSLLGIFQQIKTALEEKNLLVQKRIALEAEMKSVVAELQQNRTEFALAFESQMEQYYIAFDEGFQSIEQGMMDRDADKIIQGNILIQKTFGREAQFTNQDEFDALMSSDDDFKL